MSTHSTPADAGDLGVGLIGCGYWGPNLLRNFRSLAGCRMAAMCDTREDRLKHLGTLYPEVDRHTNHSALLTDPSLHAIVIATGAGSHFALAREALLAGKHVLVEKPLAVTADQCLELIALAATAQCVLMVGHTFLYSPAVRRIREIVAGGEIGEMRYISARRLNLGIVQRDINVVWDLAPHDLSIIIQLMDAMPESVSCTGATNIDSRVEDVATLSLHFSGGRSAFIHNSWLEPRKVREMTIVGSRQMIVYDDVEPLEKIKVFDTRVERPPHYDTFAEFQYAYHYGDIHIPYLRQEEPLKNECQHFLDCIRTGGRPISDGDQGLNVVRILEAASESLRSSGAPVVLNHTAAVAKVRRPRLDPAQGSKLRRGTRMAAR